MQGTLPNNSTHILLKYTWTFSRIDHTLDQNLNRFKKTDIIESIFTAHNWMNLENNNKSKTGTLTELWKLNTTLLNSQWIKDEMTWGIRKYFKMKENKNTRYQNLRDAVKVLLRRKFITINT